MSGEATEKTPASRPRRRAGPRRLRVPAGAGPEDRGQPRQLLLPVRRLRGRLPGHHLLRRVQPPRDHARGPLRPRRRADQGGLRPLALHQLLQLPRALPPGGEAGRGHHLPQEHAGRPRDLPESGQADHPDLRDHRPDDPRRPRRGQAARALRAASPRAGPDGGGPGPAEAGRGGRRGPHGSQAGPGPEPKPDPGSRRPEALRLLPRLPDPGPAPGHGVRHPVDPHEPRHRDRRPGGGLLLPRPHLLQVQGQAELALGGGPQPDPRRGAGPRRLHELLRLHRDALRDPPPARGRDAPGARQRAASEDRPALRRHHPGQARGRRSCGTRSATRRSGSR